MKSSNNAFLRTYLVIKWCIHEKNLYILQENGDWGWGCSSVVDRLPSMFKVLGLLPSTAPKKEYVDFINMYLESTILIPYC